jgi:hypothetical protein
MDRHPSRLSLLHQFLLSRNYSPIFFTLIDGPATSGFGKKKNNPQNKRETA